ncbi:uncharacterized protein LOC121915122 isoform X2 [Sceloporus undulatus]|uniref:uncharacterized protein LOC121915122 isoform X2 n=1 Tax=Sceloporus undulatus TaxID=8520 RepID=UPI001C4D41CD|nr:uncharacterized protein LOC121915122 isoform X2 [Sceloporus undulatus]
MLSLCRKAYKETKKMFKAAKKTIFSCFRGSKQDDENLGIPPSTVDEELDIPPILFEQSQFSIEETSVKMKVEDTEAQGSNMPKQNVVRKKHMWKKPLFQCFHTKGASFVFNQEMQQLPVSPAPYVVGPDEEGMVTQWSSDVSYPLSSSTSTVDEELDIPPILFEQSQFSIEEKNEWVHKMCQKFTSLPSQMRDHMTKTVAQRHLLSVVEHCFESDEDECIEFLAEIVKSPKCNLDIVIRMLYDKAKEGSWLPEEGVQKLSAKVKAARYLIPIIKCVCDPRRLMFWYDLLCSMYVDIWNSQPRRSDEDGVKNMEIYLQPGEIVHIIRILKNKEEEYMRQILPDVAN